jgi:GNAT superfamily N-acetyltransferase
MIDVHFRFASVNDVETLIQHDNHIHEAIIRDKIARNEIIVAYDGETFAGWLRYGLFWDMIPFMNMLFLLPEYRGRGIGRRLVEHWENLMLEQGYKTVMTSTQQNECAQHFYNALGYVAIGGFIQSHEPISNESYEIILSKVLEERQ